MFRMLGVLTIVAALGGPALAQYRPQPSRLPERSYPMTRAMYQQQVEFWNDRADLARLYDLQVTFEGGWRFNDASSIRRLDDRALRFQADELAESQREVARAERLQFRDNRNYYDDDYGPFHRQPVSGRDMGADRARQLLVERQRLYNNYRAMSARMDPYSLGQKFAILDRLIELEREEVQRDMQLLRAQGWQEPAGVY